MRAYVDHYNNVRLNSATGYITPKDMLAGRQQEIHAGRDRKLEAARNNVRFVASKPLDALIALCYAWGCGGSTSSFTDYTFKRMISQLSRFAPAWLEYGCLVARG